MSHYGVDLFLRFSEGFGVLYHRQDEVLEPCYCLGERHELLGGDRVDFSLTVSMLPRCREYKDHLRSKSSSGLGS
jgi:hypothetical protein